MFNESKLVVYIGMAGILILLLSACGPKVPPKTNNVYGQVIGPDGPVAGASVWLSGLSGEDCAALHDKILNTPEILLTEAEFYQAEGCLTPLASATTDTEGNYFIENVPAGWCRISFQWQQNQPPNMKLEAIPAEDGYYSYVVGSEWRGAQKLEVVVMEDAPEIYLMAIGNPSMNFSADTEMEINFIW